MAEFKIGDLVFLRSNAPYNINVETGKSALLIPGMYSCEKDEMNTKLICIIPIFKKKFLQNDIFLIMDLEHKKKFII